MLKISALTVSVFIINTAYAQNPSEFTLSVEAKISNQGSGKTGFKEWKAYPTRTLQTLSGFKPTDAAKTDKYGGRLDKKANATGFYYMKKVDGRWWSIDPDGGLFIQKAVNAVDIGPSDVNKEAFAKLFSSPADWAAKTTTMLRDMNFNGSGAWSGVKTLKETAPTVQPLAYNVMMNFMGSYGSKKGAYQQSGHLGYPDNVIFVFDSAFVKHCDEYAKQLAANKDEKNLFGYFSDNEMPFPKKALDNYLGKKDTLDEGYKAAKQWLIANHIQRDSIKDTDRDNFLGFVVDRYFSIVSKAIRKNDPNHMYLGCRFHSYEKGVRQVFEAAGKYLDGISINYYNEWTPKDDQMKKWATWSGKPFLITEWYVKGEDSGMGNFSGAGWVVKTQAERGMFYQNFVLGLLESGDCVGWHWFKYQDNDPSYKNVDPSNTDANKGILNSKYELYTPLTDQMKALNQQAYSLIDFFDKRNNLKAKN